MTVQEYPEGHDGPEHAKCGAKKRKGGGACGQTAGWGTDHPGTGPCKLHGGTTRAHVTAARTVIAQRAVATYGLPRDIDPAAALLEEVHRTAGHVAWLARKVAELRDDDLTWGITQETEKAATAFPGTDTKATARPSIWLELYHRERRHLVQVSKAALDAGISERLVRLAEQQGVMLAEVIRRSADGLLTELAALLDEETAGRVRRAWPRWLARIVPEEIAAVTGGPQ
ncbi:hypothetical protein [Streptomyces variabilis]